MVKQVPFETLSSTISGIAFATPTEATKALQQRSRSLEPQAVLCTINVEEAGIGMWLPVRDSAGRPAERYRYLIQIGTRDIKIDLSGIERGGVMTSKTVRAAIVFERKHVDTAVWESSLKNDPVYAVRNWLKDNSMKVLDIQPPRASLQPRRELPHAIAGRHRAGGHTALALGSEVGDGISTDYELRY